MIASSRYRFPRRAIFAVATFLAFATVGGRRGAADPAPEAVDKVFAAFDKPGSPGVALGVIRDGKLIYTRGYGEANLDFGAPLNSESVFYIASTSKQFTAACVLLLEGQGKISLDDDVRKYVPEIPGYGTPITIRHLIHHSSGLRDYLSLLSMAGRSFEDYFANADGIAILSRQKGLNFPPGDEYLYSNSGYILLAEIVARASGKPIDQYAQENIFGPLGMKHTRFDLDRSAVIRNRVTSYRKGKDSVFHQYLKNEDAVGDGGILTTVEDLALWDRNFYANKLGRSDLIERMLTAGKLNDGTAQDYAAGLGVGEYRGLSMVSHAGGWLGFRTQLMRFPSENLSVICLANLDSIDPDRLCMQVAELYLGDKMTPSDRSGSATTALQSSAAELDPWVGSFRDILNGQFVGIAAKDGRLTYTSLGRTIVLDRTGAGEFRSSDPAIPFEVLFEGPPGDPAALVRKMRGRKPQRMERARMVEVKSGDLAEYAGEFWSDELEQGYQVRLTEERLELTRRGSEPSRLTPTVRDGFRSQGGHLDYTRDAAGKITGFHFSVPRVHDIIFVRRNSQ